MNDFLKAHGITIGVVILGVIAIIFYGQARYKAGRSDLLTELEKAPAETTQTHSIDTTKLTSKGEGRGVPLSQIDASWGHFGRIDKDAKVNNWIGALLTTPPTDTCDYTPYVVEVKDSSFNGEVICFPEKQTARWDLKADCPQNVFTITQTKYFEKDLGFWFQVLGGYSNQPLAGGLIGYKSIGIGVLAEDKPIWTIAFKWEF